MNPLRPSWGEAYTSIERRMLAAVEQAFEAVDSGDVVLVSHQLPIWVTRRRVEGRHLWHRPDRRQCALGSVTTLVYDGGVCTAVEYAEPSGPGVAAQGNVGA